MWAGAAGLRGSCVRLQTLRGGHGAALLSGGAQALHTSVASCGSKNLLKKFASKTRKKFWYEGPSLGSHLTQKPSKFEFLTKSTLRKARKEDTIRLRALNGLLYKAVTELLCTPEVSQEVYDLNVEVSKVSVTSDFSACRVYWKIGVSADQNRHTEAVLQRSAAYIRHLLMSQQTLRNVPPIVFIQDKKDIVLAEVDRLLAVADFGPPEERDDLAQDGLRSPEGLSSHDALEPATPPNLCGIDHEALTKQIMEYKRKKEKGLLPCMSLAQPSGREPLPDVTHLLRRRKKTSSRRHRDTSPEASVWVRTRTRTAAQSMSAKARRQKRSGKQRLEVMGCSKGSMAKENRGRGEALVLAAPAPQSVWSALQRRLVKEELSV